MTEPQETMPAVATPNVPALLPQQVKQARDKLCELLRETDSQAAQWVDEVRRRRPATPAVVVVGETKRGKSTLVNALLGEPGLSPVDADAVTASYLVFRHGQCWSARAWYPDQREPVHVEVAEMREKVCADASDQPATPRSVLVDAPLEALSKVTIVDTPGAGGLGSWHGQLAGQAASAATALLFVLDASAPLTRTELEFLHDVANHVETVVFALTKTDRYRGWREILEADQALLAEHAPRFADAPIYPVSARMLELAASAPTEQAGVTLRERAGIAELRAELERLVAGRAAMLGEANVLRALSTVLDELRVKLESEQRALTAGEAEADALRARREQLVAARRSATRGWQLRLRGALQRTRVELGHEVSRQIREVQNWCRRSIDTADRQALAAFPQEVDAALQDVSTRISGVLSERLSAVADGSLAELFSASEIGVLRSQLAQGEQPPLALQTPEKHRPSTEDKLLLLLGISGGLGIGRAVAIPLAGLGVAAMNPLVLPVTIVLGLGAGWWMARTRKHLADKQHLKQWLADGIAEARSRLEQLVSEQLIEAEQQLSLALDDALTRRIDSIDGELREVDAALRMDAAERGRRLRTVQRRLEEVTTGRHQCEQLLESIRALRDRLTP